MATANSNEAVASVVANIAATNSMVTRCEMQGYAGIGSISIPYKTIFERGKTDES